MKKMSIPFLLVLTCLVSACSKSPEKDFSENGISFTCPSGWKIDETENLGESYYICVEKEGFNSSGLVTILTFSELIDKQQYLDAYIEEFTEVSMLKNVTFSDPTDATYGSYKGKAIQFKGDIMGLAHQGIIYAFDTNGKTVFITQQEAVEDKSKNEDGFNTIRKSFQVN